MRELTELPASKYTTFKFQLFPSCHHDEYCTGKKEYTYIFYCIYFFARGKGKRAVGNNLLNLRKTWCRLNRLRPVDDDTDMDSVALMNDVHAHFYLRR